MLIDEQDGYIFAVTSIAVESGFNGGCLGSGIDDEEVLLGVRRLCYVLDPFGQNGQYRIGAQYVWKGAKRTPMPARSKPVTESLGSC